MSGTDAAPPAWVTTRDGRLEPFDADRICRALFEAGESLGLGNPMLARELTDAVVHFLATSPCEPAPTTAFIAEQTAKVVRQLGQPALAAAFLERAARPREQGPVESPEEHKARGRRRREPPHAGGPHEQQELF